MSEATRVARVRQVEAAVQRAVARAHERYVLLTVSEAGRAATVAQYPDGQRSGAVEHYVRELNRVSRKTSTVLYDRRQGHHLYRNVN